MSEFIIENAKIRSTMLGVEDHGILTCFLNLDFGSSGQGFGGYGLDQWDESLKKRIGTAWGAEFIRRVLETLEVDEWEHLLGRPLRAEHSNGEVRAIGHFIKDKWFRPKVDLAFLLDTKAKGG